MVSIVDKIRSYSVLPGAYVRLYRNKPIALSFDISGRCNLHCPYCYWWESRREKELSLKQIVKLAEEYWRQGIIQATWIGGEPTLRPDVLKAVTPIFPINWIVTNGIPVKNFDPFSLKNTWVILSLDGVGKAHDRSRNRKGLYKLLKKRFWNKPILTTTTLHQGNKNQPEKLLKEWSQSNILGMTFEFATPIGRKANPKWSLIGKDRDEVIDKLISLKKKYNRFLANSIKSLNLMRPENIKKWASPSKCPMASLAISLDELGERKVPCVLGASPNNKKGKKPICLSCGCHVPGMFQGLKGFDMSTIDNLVWFLRRGNPLKADLGH